jgi:hypothetical protein
VGDPTLSDQRDDEAADESLPVIEYFDELAGLPLEQAVELFRLYRDDRNKLAAEARRLKQGSLN